MLRLLAESSLGNLLALHANVNVMAGRNCMPELQLLSDAPRDVALFFQQYL